MNPSARPSAIEYENGMRTMIRNAGIVYTAANEELIREDARQGGFPANRISKVHAIIDPTTAESATR